MPLAKDIDAKIVESMRAKDSARVNTLRGIKAACVNELVAKRRKPEEMLSDEEIVAVIRRLVNQRKDSIEQFRRGGRAELAAAEEAELKILESYLPAQMPEDEIRKIAEGVKTRLGIADRAKLGQLIGAVMKETKGKADGGTVKRIVESLFQ